MQGKDYLKLIDMKLEDELTKTDNIVESCSTYEDGLDGYCLYISYANEETLIENLGGGNKLAAKDLRSKLKMPSALKQLLLVKLNEGADIEYDSITDYLIFEFEDCKGVLKHFGLIKEEEEITASEFGYPGGDIYDEIETVENREEEIVSNMEEITPTYPNYPQYTPYEEPAQPSDKGELVEINQPISMADDHKEVEEKEEVEEDSDSSITVSKSDYNKLLIMFQLLCDKSGVSFEEVERHAQIIIESEDNPYLDLDEVEEILEIFKMIGKYDEDNVKFILAMYKQGSVKEVTELLNGQLETYHKEGLI